MYIGDIDNANTAQNLMRILMNTAHAAPYIWQQPDWPIWRYDASRLALALASARQQQGIIIGKAQAVGLSLSKSQPCTAPAQ